MEIGGLFDLPIEFYHGRIPFIITDLIDQIEKINAKNSDQLFNPKNVDSNLEIFVSILKTKRVKKWRDFSYPSILSISLVLFINSLTKETPLITEDVQHSLFEIEILNNSYSTLQHIRKTFVKLYPGRYRTLLYLTRFLKDIKIIDEDRLFKIFSKPFFGKIIDDLFNNKNPSNLYSNQNLNLNFSETDKNKMKLNFLNTFKVIILNHDTIFAGAVLGDAAFLSDKQISSLIHKFNRGANLNQKRSKSPQNSNSPKTPPKNANANINQNLNAINNGIGSVLKTVPVNKYPNKNQENSPSLKNYSPTASIREVPVETNVILESNQPKPKFNAIYFSSCEDCGSFIQQKSSSSNSPSSRANSPKNNSFSPKNSLNSNSQKSLIESFFEEEIKNPKKKIITISPTNDTVVIINPVLTEAQNQNDTKSSNVKEFEVEYPQSSSSYSDNENSNRNQFSNILNEKSQHSSFLYRARINSNSPNRFEIDSPSNPSTSPDRKSSPRGLNDSNGSNFSSLFTSSSPNKRKITPIESSESSDENNFQHKLNVPQSSSSSSSSSSENNTKYLPKISQVSNNLKNKNDYETSKNIKNQILNISPPNLPPSPKMNSSTFSISTQPTLCVNLNSKIPQKSPTKKLVIDNKSKVITDRPETNLNTQIKSKYNLKIDEKSLVVATTPSKQISKISNDDFSINDNKKQTDKKTKQHDILNSPSSSSSSHSATPLPKNHHQKHQKQSKQLKQKIQSQKSIVVDQQNKNINDKNVFPMISLQNTDNSSSSSSLKSWNSDREPGNNGTFSSDIDQSYITHQTVSSSLHSNLRMNSIPDISDNDYLNNLEYLIPQNGDINENQIHNKNTNNNYNKKTKCRPPVLTSSDSIDEALSSSRKYSIKPEDSYQDDKNEKNQNKDKVLSIKNFISSSSESDNFTSLTKPQKKAIKNGSQYTSTSSTSEYDNEIQYQTLRRSDIDLYLNQHPNSKASRTEKFKLDVFFNPQLNNQQSVNKETNNINSDTNNNKESNKEHIKSDIKNKSKENPITQQKSSENKKKLSSNLKNINRNNSEEDYYEDEESSSTSSTTSFNYNSAYSTAQTYSKTSMNLNNKLFEYSTSDDSNGNNKNLTNDINDVNRSSFIEGKRSLTNEARDRLPPAPFLAGLTRGSWTVQHNEQLPPPPPLSEHLPPPPPLSNDFPLTTFDNDNRLNMPNNNNDLSHLYSSKDSPLHQSVKNRSSILSSQSGKSIANENLPPAPPQPIALTKKPSNEQLPPAPPQPLVLPNTTHDEKTNFNNLYGNSFGNNFRNGVGNTYSPGFNNNQFGNFENYGQAFNRFEGKIPTPLPPGVPPNSGLPPPPPMIDSSMNNLSGINNNTLGSKGKLNNEEESFVSGPFSVNQSPVALPVLHGAPPPPTPLQPTEPSPPPQQIPSSPIIANSTESVDSVSGKSSDQNQISTSDKKESSKERKKREKLERKEKERREKEEKKLRKEQKRLEKGLRKKEEKKEEKGEKKKEKKKK
ncbi:hypothetical protein TRFO_23669 [Tritrichomonas foetus]|uniref:Rho-GAP domain-containing protein n=1 Tax=Tritrichomonas foetus TaxID=1144522 RepID=A0A1J4K9Y0_9EUKA|nr:hypothetical protein TRFO_23669 [Tritrichomonas foetus]|eukprot:OHT08035.1 hypothetical protein TRFO_23669 [Tritrichomonas foetus]